jgi:hypothetical protein
VNIEIDGTAKPLHKGNGPAPGFLNSCPFSCTAPQ